MSFPVVKALQDSDVFKTTTSTSITGGNDLGTVGQTVDGRQFRWCKNGAVALSAGRVVQAEVPGANFDELAVVAAQAVGDKTVTITNGNTAITANMFRGGYLNVEDDTGEGHMYRIASHPAADTSASCVITLAVGLQVAITTSTTVGLTKHKCDAVIIHPSPPTAAVVGVAPTSIAANAYFWAQFRGQASVLTDGVITAGKYVMPSASVDGAVAAYTTGGDDEIIIGQTVELAADTEHSAIDLFIP